MAAALEVVDEELLVVEPDTVDVAGDGIVTVVSVPDVFEEDEEEEVVASDVAPVPRVVGVAKELALCVSGKSAVVSAIADGGPRSACQHSSRQVTGCAATKLRESSLEHVAVTHVSLRARIDVWIHLGLHPTIRVHAPGINSGSARSLAIRTASDYVGVGVLHTIGPCRACRCRGEVAVYVAAYSICVLPPEEFVEYLQVEWR